MKYAPERFIYVIFFQEMKEHNGRVSIALCLFLNWDYSEASSEFNTGEI